MGREVIAEVIGPGSASPLDNREEILPIGNEFQKGTILRLELPADGDRANVTTLAEEGSSAAKLYAIAERNKVSMSRSAESREQAVKDFEKQKSDAIVDARSTPFVTIDGEGTRDLDQALFVEKSERGYRIQYAIADASRFVPRNSPLFADAIVRGASYYFPSFAIPMLPRELSEGKVSLNENVDRHALIFTSEIDEAGEAISTEVNPAIIRSRAKLSFVEAQELIKGDNEKEYSESLKAFDAAAALRIERAEKLHIARYRRHELSLGTKGSKLTIKERKRENVESSNEQLSLLCNIEGARILSESTARFIDPIYRVHPAPSPKSVAKFRDLSRHFAELHNDSRFAWNELSLATYLRALPHEHPATEAIHQQAIMMNVRSEYADAPGRHYGVGAEPYGRFSAPMRELVGLYLHGEMTETLNGKGYSNVELRDKIIDIGNRSRSRQKKIDREVFELLLDQVLRDGRDIYSGTIIGIRNSRFYVMLDEPRVEVKVYTKSLAGKHKADRQGLRLTHESGVDAAILGAQVELCGPIMDGKAKRWRFEKIRLLS